MQVLNCNFNFTIKGDKQNAICHKLKVYKHPHVRVEVNREKGTTDIYIFMK